MKLTVLPIQSYQATDRTTGKKTTRYRVIWRVYLGGGQRHQRKRGGFSRKGEAEAFADVLRKAALQTGGWAFDEDFQPTDADHAKSGHTVFDLTSEFVRVHWDAYRPNHRERVVGRLNQLRRLLVTEPLTVPATYYLRDSSLRGAVEPPDEALDPVLVEGRRWLREHSLPVSELNRNTLMPVWEAFVVGRPHSTARTYWQTVKTVVSWGRDAGIIEGDPLRGFRAVRRDMEAEKVDEHEVPSEFETWQLAITTLLLGGPAAGVAVLLAGFGGLRGGELAHLTRDDITIDETGVVHVRVRGSRNSVTARFSDDGSTVADGPVKGRSADTPPRKVPLRRDVGEVVSAYVRRLSDNAPTSPLLVGPRGARLNPATFRDGPFARAVAELFGPGHRLQHMTPHTLRHAAVSYWLRWGVPHKHCQRWGNWKSLQVMLDTYSAFLPEHDDTIREALGFAGQSPTTRTALEARPMQPKSEGSPQGLTVENGGDNSSRIDAQAV